MVGNAQNIENININYDEIKEELLLIFIITIPNFLNNNYVKNRLFKIIQTKLLNFDTIINNNILHN